jgi:hypothetical protein
LNVPRVFVLGSSPLEMSALALKRGFRGMVGMRYPVSDAAVQALMFAEPT